MSAHLLWLHIILELSPKVSGQSAESTVYRIHKRQTYKKSKFQNFLNQNVLWHEISNFFFSLYGRKISKIILEKFSVFTTSRSFFFVALFKNEMSFLLNIIFRQRNTNISQHCYGNPASDMANQINCLSMLVIFCLHFLSFLRNLITQL